MPSVRTPVPESTQQFANTPRFSFGKTTTASQAPRSPSPPKPAVVQALRASARPAEDVEEYADGDEDDEMLDHEQAQALPTTELDWLEQADSRPWTNDLALSPKRRRLDNQETRSSIANSAFKHPQIPASYVERQTPHFIPTSTPSVAGEQEHHARPAFLRPSAPPQEVPSEPLPEVFSPHKCRQRFVPGGMAATVQQWVLEVGQAAAQSRRGKGYLKGEDYVLRVKVEDVEGDGPFMMRGVEATGEVVEIMLASNGRGPRGGGPDEVAVGRVVGVRAPVWEVDTDGKTCRVGVDWRVL